MPTLKSKTLTVSIDCPASRVYRFVSNAKNLPRWARAFCRSIRKSGGAWIVESPDVNISVPMRVVPNGSGSEVIFTLFQPPGMPAEQFARDVEWVGRDLKGLKNVLETGGKAIAGMR
jgi:uncharacterized protein YndB with AHSA1/START domain